eukprot:COSAG02_NODE_2459_length_8804_cov_3.707295_4_plen_238_part_00
MAVPTIDQLADMVRAVIKYHSAEMKIPEWEQHEFYDKIFAASRASTDVSEIAQLIWTSAAQLRGKEFCSILNAMVRLDKPPVIDQIAGISRALNMLCVTVGTGLRPGACHPPDFVCFRGGGFDMKYKEFFVPGRQFRQPAYLATSFSKSVADGFIQRAKTQCKVLWIIRIDPKRKCNHVNFVLRSNVPGEAEYLFAPYSAFEVLNATWTSHGPSIIELLASPDNKEVSEYLHLAPWS